MSGLTALVALLDIKDGYYCLFPRPSWFFSSCAVGHDEFLEVIPLAQVVTDSLKNTNIWFNNWELNKVSAICPQEGNHCFDAAHPQVIEDDATADFANLGIKIKVNESSIEAMVAINENEIEARFGSREIRGNAVRTIFDERKAGIFACNGEVGISMGKSDAMPVGILKRIDGSMVAKLIPGNGCKEIERAKTVSHADLQSGFGFDG